MSHTPHPTAIRLAVNNYLQQVWIQKRLSLPGLILPGIGTILLAYVPPLIIARIITDFNGTVPTLREAAPYIWAFAGVWLLGEIVWRVALYFVIRAEIRGMKNLYESAIDTLLHKDISFFHNNFAGSLTKKALGYGRNFEGFMDTLMFGVSTNVLPVIFATVILFHYSAWLGIALIGLLVPTMLIILPLIRRRRKLVAIRESASNVMAGHVADIISNMDAVQSFAHHEHEAAHHRKYVGDYLLKAQKSWDYQNTRVDMVISPLYTLINVVGLALAIALGDDAAGMATVFVVFSYYASTTRILWEFNRIYRNLENSVTEAAQFTELLLTESKVTDPANPQHFHVSQGSVAFRHVDFKYEKSRRSLFQNLNLEIKPGEKVALVGHSGGGKTTITKLLLRFADVSKGQIAIDGQDIAHATLKDLRRSIAYVPQEPIMFHRSIRENIRYGNLEATDEEVVRAATQANAHEFIEKLPDGYDTPVGERGVKLSGGQRQRIAIARAMVKNAPILVLDEATSALDSESEKLIQESLWTLMEGRTAIVIAHRLSTIQKMDRIIVLDDGRIAEEGSHRDLLANDGIYARLWAHQSGGFIEE